MANYPYYPAQPENMIATVADVLKPGLRRIQIRWSTNHESKSILDQLRVTMIRIICSVIYMKAVKRSFSVEVSIYLWFESSLKNFTTYTTLSSFYTSLWVKQTKFHWKIKIDLMFTELVKFNVLSIYNIHLHLFALDVEWSMTDKKSKGLI